MIIFRKFSFLQHLLGTFDLLAFHWEEEVHQELVVELLYYFIVHYNALLHIHVEVLWAKVSTKLGILRRENLRFLTA